MFKRQGWCNECLKSIPALAYFCGICGSPNENALVGALDSSVCATTSYHYLLSVRKRHFCSICGIRLATAEKEKIKIIDRLVASVDFARPLWLCEVLFKADALFVRLGDTNFIFRLAEKAVSQGMSKDDFLDNFYKQYPETQRIIRVLISKKLNNL